MTARDRRRVLICIGLSAAVGLLMALASAFHLLGFADQMQRLADDRFVFKSRAGVKAEKVVLVHVDEKSIAALKGQYGRFFSWPRSLHAQVLRNLADAKARVVAYDVLFDAPGCPASAPPPCAEDAQLAEAIAYATGRPGGGTAVVLPVDGDPPEPDLQPGQPITFRDSIPPLPEFAGAATALGHIHPIVDVDGAVRRLPLVARIEGRGVPALALQAAASYLRRPRAVDGEGANSLTFAGRSIPTDAHYVTTVNFLGPPSHLPAQIGAGPVPVVSFVDVLNGTFDRSAVADKLVFVGLTAVGFADDYIVPTSPGVKMTGVEVHAQAAEMLLRGAYLAPQATLSTALVILLASVVPGAILARWQPILAGGVTIALFVAYAIANGLYAGTATSSLDEARTFTVLNSVYPGLAMLGTFIVVMLYRIVFEQAEQRATKGVMGKYLSPAVMTEVLKDPERLRLGGQKREMSVLFSDIRGFTTVSERMDPAELVNFLNEYLTEMTGIVFQHEGVLDKYLGDAIMAFWGAPKDQPNHAELACRTGYHMMRRLRELQAGWSARGLPPLNIGVGINTGPMTVGNVGSRMRFDYTVMGDAVNLGSRLEGVNKEYGTDVIIGATTLAAVGDKFVVRYLDLIAVAGKQEPTAIYELIAPVEATEALPPQGFLDAWDTAVLLYRDQQFEAAAAAFRKVLAIRPDDPPALLYLERCRDMVASPPGVAWDGVYVFTHK